MAGALRWKEIADDLRAKINRGELGPGAKLPTEPDLEAEYKAGRNTIRKAVQSLVDSGLVYTKRGSGTFVSDEVEILVTTLSMDPATGLGGGEGVTFFEEVRAQGREPGAEAPEIKLVRVPSALVDRLGVSAGATVLSRYQVRSVDRKPSSIQTSYYPMSLVERGATRLLEVDDIEEGTVKYLKSKLGITQVGYREQFRIRESRDEEITFFRLPRDARAHVIEFFRTTYDQEGKPIRLTVTTYPADRHEFLMDIGIVPPKVRDGVVTPLSSEKRLAEEQEDREAADGTKSG